MKSNKLFKWINIDEFDSYAFSKVNHKLKRIINNGFYDPELLDWYTPNEFNRMDQWIDHS